MRSASLFAVLALALLLAAVMPVNILATLGPWLVVVGLAGIGTAVLILRRRGK